MEGSARVFAGEFCGSTLVVPSGDAGAPGWVVTPGGAWCRMVYVGGALTEASESGGMLRCRLADPTGAFDIVTHGRNTPLVQAVCALPVPSFVTVTGCAQMYQRNGTTVVSIRPEQVAAIDRAGRDQNLLTTAEYTLRRLDLLRLTLEGRCTDERILRTIRHYDTSREKIRELMDMVGGAVQSVRPPEPTLPVEEVRGIVLDLIRDARGPRGIGVEEILGNLTRRGIRREDVLAALEALIVDDECYQPQKGYVKLL